MNKKILIIDDDHEILEMLGIVFQDSGYEIILSNKGMDCDQISILRPDLMLLDVRLEGYEKTGDQICRELKTQGAKVPVVLMSAEHNLQKIALDCHADDYLCKPFDISLLRSKVNNKI